MHVRQAIVLVGGKGTRLGSLTSSTPKPLLELAPGVRFLDLLLEQFSRHGFSDIILLAGHLGEQVEQLYAGRRVYDATVRVVREPEPAGTGGALSYVASDLAPWFLMANGDSFLDFNIRQLARPPFGEITGRLALRGVPDVGRYGTVELLGNQIVSFQEKGDRRGAGLISGGVYLLNSSVLELVHGPCSIEHDVFPKLAAAGRLQGMVADGYFLDIGLPETYGQAKAELPQRRFRPAAFFDRDGVLNRDHGYTHRPEDLTWVEGAPEAVRELNETGYLVFVVTNQAGIARGYYTEQHADAFHNRMQEELAQSGAHIDGFYTCPFHEEATVDLYRHSDHPDRKPNPGMILRAMKEWPIRANGSFLIGDRATDVEAATRAGIPGHLFSGGDLRATVQAALKEHRAR